jgi:hypothetical protein
VNPSAEESGDEGADGYDDLIIINNLVDACKLVDINLRRGYISLR